jgi:Mg-chelatase subunit ChlD
VRILESPTDDTYRSVLAQWGRSNPDGIHEILVPPAVVGSNVDAPDAADVPEEAMPLADGAAVDGRVTRNKDVDWYAVEVPEGLDVLELPVVQSPGAGVALTLQDEAGQPVRIWGVPLDDPASVVWTARVRPGRYLVRVEQPQLSAAFTFDTSGSMAAYVPQVREALRTFVRGVVQGDEVVKLSPFGVPALTDWADDPYLLEQVVSTGITVGDSSEAEATMIPAVKGLLRRKGIRAMLLLTDAETGSYDDNTELWDWLDDVRPSIFTVHIGGSGNPDLTTSLMEDWALSSGGHYQYAATQSDIDTAFARMTTWLRRPADYRLSWKASNAVLPPSRIVVGMPLGPNGAPLNPPLSKGVGVALAIDTSKSMNEPLGNTDRMTVAKDVLSHLVSTTIPEGVPVSLRIFRPKARACDSTQVAPLRPLDREKMLDKIRKLRGVTQGTPLASMIAALPEDLGGVEGPKVIIVVTDGRETCKGDPGLEVQRLVDGGYEASVSIVGLALDRADLKADMKRWAEAGGGTFYDAQDPATLETAIAAVLQAPYRVYDETGAVVATGVVGGAAVDVPTGVFRVEVLSDPPVVWEGIDLIPGETAELTLGQSDLEGEGTP